MGGGGSYYDRDTKDGYDRTSAGNSVAAEKAMSRSRMDPAMSPKDRRIKSTKKNPWVFAYDVTGSVDNLPMIIFDKMPMIAGQIVQCGYLKDPDFSLAAIGDVEGDRAPIQIGNFSAIKELDEWLRRIWREKGGGGQSDESYEFTAYYYARYCDIPSAEVPGLIITGDEGFRSMLYAGALREHFGGQHEDVSAKQVFDELKKKFKGNVFLIHRRYPSGHQKSDAQIVREWTEVLGAEHIVPLPEDTAIADIALGIFALTTGSRTLDEYLQDMKTTREVPQTDERCQAVRQALELVAKIAPAAKKTKVPKTTDAKADKTKKKGGKPGRL